MDEDKSDNVAKTKLELEIEKHVLSTTVKLSDGTSGFVFSRGPKNESQMFLYNCHLCGVPNLPGERCLQTHIAGRKHQSKLSCSIVDADSFRATLMQRNKVQMQIAPGEPVPPGFENEVKPVAELQSVLDKYKDQPLVGLEYVLELTSRQEKEPFYNCLLCNKKGDPRTILNHITSYNHRIKFLEKHFPTASRELEQYRYNVDARGVINRVIQSICESIEDCHGRLTPDVYEASEYKKNPMKFLQQVINDRHFDEKHGPNFLNVIDHKQINDQIKAHALAKNMVKRNPSPPGAGGRRGRGAAAKAGGRDNDDDRKSLDSISSISSSSLSRSRSRSPILNRILMMRKKISNQQPPTQQGAQRPPAYHGLPIVRSRSPERFYRRSRSRSRSRSPYRARKRISVSPPRRANSSVKFGPNREAAMAFSIAKHREKSPNVADKRQMLPTPKELSQQASEIANERYKWEKFRCMVEIAVTELNKSQKEYEKNPEKHPLYSDEWKKFWNRRYKELQAEKKDPAKHDFKPEWIEFWTKRMKELFDENIENKKQEIRKKLGLPDESEERTDQLKEQYTIIKKDVKEKEKIPSPIPSDDDDVIIEEDVRIPRPLSRNRSSRVSVERGNRRSRSPPPYEVSAHGSRRRTSREKISRERISRDRFSPIPRPRSRSREYYRERDYYEHQHHRRSPPPPQPTHYGETYDEWAKRYYGPTRTRPVYVRSVEYKEDTNDEPLTVVSVLRLLTALEEHLGSLGPKIVDLLAKALALEKVKANSADDLLMNEDHCVIFETVKEKLKGQLIAEVIEPQKINAVKRAIKNIAAVIHMVNEKAKEKEKEMREKESEKRHEPYEQKTILATKPDDPEAVDKGEIAKKIAASLIAQGKTDITTDQLEVLINTFIAMSKQSKGNKPMSTATFIKDLEGGDSSHSNTTTKSTNSVADELEKSLESTKRHEEKEDTNNAIESLTDSDLQTLLQNFKNLSGEEQQELILYLKKLESTDPARVEKLRKYVNIGSQEKEKRVISPVPSQPSTKPFDIFDISDDVDKIIEMNKSPVKKIVHDANEFDIEPASRTEDMLTAGKKIKMSHFIEDNEDRRKFLDSEDDDDDDYSFDDVLKAASQKVRTGNNNPSLEMHDEMSQNSVKSLVNDNSSTKSNSGGGGLNLSLTDTKNLIANLMGSLQKNVASRTNHMQQQQQNLAQANNSYGGPPVLPQPINQLNPMTSNLNLPYYMQQPQQQQQHQQMQQQPQQMQQQPQQMQQQPQQMQQQPQQMQQPPNQSMYNNAMPQGYQPQPQMAPIGLNQMGGFDYSQMQNHMPNPYDFAQNQMFQPQMMQQQQQPTQQQQLQQQQHNQRQSHYVNHHQQQNNLKFLSGGKK